MFRRLLNLVSAGSLVLCAAALVLWALSHRTTYAVGILEPGVRWRVVSRHGELRVDNRPQVEADRDTRERLKREFDAHVFAARVGLTVARQSRASFERDVGSAVDERHPRYAEVEQARADLNARVDAARARVDALRAAHAANPGRASAEVVPVAVAHGWLVAAAGVLPAVWLAAACAGTLRRRRRLAARCCPDCGYDLRATPDRCSECGAVPAAKG